ncbi:helix-turn-helix domain-containing protein [Ferrimonas pelagia]|uniref:HTH luxR-type domain-containing protein n=1 Tax=Ferrimonas pelagia TaxID=1177826 RepID=A0ABP9FEJ3_9GAMM
MKHLESLIRQAEAVSTLEQLQAWFALSEVQASHCLGMAVATAQSPTVFDVQQVAATGIVAEAHRAPLIACLMSESKPRLWRELTQEPAAERCVVVPRKGGEGESVAVFIRLPLIPVCQELIWAEKLGWFWGIILPYLLQAYRRALPAKPMPLISPREKECLRWASEGKTSWEISQILQISERTVNFHLSNCMEKTGSVNRQQAIAKCLIRGQLADWV